MRKPIDLSNLTESELGYIAGILDGDGSIGLYTWKGKALYLSITKSIIISNTNEALANWLMDRVGGGKSISITVYKGKECVLYQWRINSHHDVWKLLTAIKDRMIIKKDQAEVMLGYLGKKIPLEIAVQKLKTLKRKV